MTVEPVHFTIWKITLAGQWLLGVLVAGLVGLVIWAVFKNRK